MTRRLWQPSVRAVEGLGMMLWTATHGTKNEMKAVNKLAADKIIDVMMED
jgi:hypothetical protein